MKFGPGRVNVHEHAIDCYIQWNRKIPSFIIIMDSSLILTILTSEKNPEVRYGEDHAKFETVLL